MDKQDGKKLLTIKFDGDKVKTVKHRQSVCGMTVFDRESVFGFIDDSQAALMPAIESIVSHAVKWFGRDAPMSIAFAEGHADNDPDSLSIHIVSNKEFNEAYKLLAKLNREWRDGLSDDLTDMISVGLEFDKPKTKRAENHGQVWRR